MSNYPSYPVGPGSNTRPPEDPAVSKKMAGWALALCCIPCLLSLIVGIVLAINVLTRGKDGRDHGKTMAIVALCVAGLWLMVGAAAVIVGLASQPDRDADGQLSKGGEIAAEQIRVGDCLDLPSETEVESIQATPCSEPHEAEVYAAFELPAGEFPGAATVVKEAEEGCAERFFGYVGIAPPDSALQIVMLYPQESSWSLSREVHCVADEPGAKKVTGSVNGAER